jgi:hypothetical protein
MEQVARNKSSLLLNEQIQNKQTLQPFTKIIKIESVYVFTKVIKNAKQKAWVQSPSSLIKMGEEAQVL